MERWLDNFQRILVLCPVLTGEDLHNTHSTVWKPVSEVANADRVRFVPLPYATSLASFTARLSSRPIGHSMAIQQSRYLCFAIGGLFGDWGAVACLEAKRLAPSVRRVDRSGRAQGGLNALRQPQSAAAAQGRTRHCA